MVSLSTTKKVIQKEYTENITKLKYYTRKKKSLDTNESNKRG